MNAYHIDFMVVGPQKAGTTWIYEYLKMLPDVCMPIKVKEVLFFDNRYNNGLDWYFWHFKHCVKGQKIGEVAPTYFDEKEVPDRLFKLNNKLNIVVCLRNPYERSWSLYLHQLRYGVVKGSFENAVKEDPRILTSSLYATHLKKWLDVFGEQVKVMYLEELREYPEEYIQEICNFLNIHYQKKDELFYKKVNPDDMSRWHWLARSASNMSCWLRKYRMYFIVNILKRTVLRDILYCGGKTPEGPSAKDYQIMASKLEPDILKLERLLNKDFDIWKHKV
jgi:hypothetical protein